MNKVRSGFLTFIALVTSNTQTSLCSLPEYIIYFYFFLLRDLFFRGNISLFFVSLRNRMDAPEEAELGLCTHEDKQQLDRKMIWALGTHTSLYTCLQETRPSTEFLTLILPSFQALKMCNWIIILWTHIDRSLVEELPHLFPLILCKVAHLSIAKRVYVINRFWLPKRWAGMADSVISTLQEWDINVEKPCYHNFLLLTNFFPHKFFSKEYSNAVIQKVIALGILDDGSTSSLHCFFLLLTRKTFLKLSFQRLNLICLAAN